MEENYDIIENIHALHKKSKKNSSAIIHQSFLQENEWGKIEENSWWLNYVRKDKNVWKIEAETIIGRILSLIRKSV